MEGVQHQISGVQQEISALEAKLRGVEEDIKERDKLRHEKRWDRLRGKEKELHEEKKALRRKESSLRRQQSGSLPKIQAITIRKESSLRRIFISKGLVGARILISKGFLAARNFIAKGLGATWLLIVRVLGGVLNARASISTAPLLISFVLTNPPIEKPVASASSGCGIQSDHFGYKSIGQEPRARSKETLEIVYDAHQSENPIHQCQGLPFYSTGLDKRVHEIQEQLENGVVVGIVGMGGIGKTTLAKQLFNSISPEYEYTCFVNNVKGVEEIPMTDHFEDTLKLIIDKCGGLPLTLEVVGRYLSGHVNDAKIWEETLEELDRAQSLTGSRNDRIWASLRISCDALLEAERKMFIEAGTFFFGQQLEHALVAWETRDNNAESSWANLLNRALVKTYRKDKWDSTCEREIEYMEIWVHEHLRDLAKNILEGDIVSGSDEGSNTRKFAVHANWWRVHTDLGPNGNRTMLQLDLPEKSEELKYVDLDGVANEGLGKNFPSELVLLKWKMRSMAQLPLISLGKMKNLALLEVENWCVRKFLGEALGNLTELRILSLCSLEGLDGLPKTFGELSLLKHLTLNDVGIRELPKSFGNLSSLVTLKIRGCSELSSLPDSFGLLSSLEELYIYDCPKLSILGESFGHLQRLKYLSLKRCERLERLPASFKDLPALQELVVDGCSSIQGLSDDLSHAKTLARLTIQGGGGVPKEVLSGNGNFWSLPALKYLSLKRFWNLEGLPPILDLPCLEELELERCNGLQGLSENLDELTSLKRLVMKGAYRLKVLPESVGRISSLREIILSDCNGLRSLPRSLRKPCSKNDRATELGNTTDTEGMRLAITECDFLKDEILRRGYVYKKGYWYPKRRHR